MTERQRIIAEITELAKSARARVLCDVVSINGGRMEAAHVRAELANGDVFDVVRPTFRHAREELRAWLGPQSERRR